MRNRWYKNVQHGKCYECVALTCDDYGYQKTECATGKIQTTKTPKLGSTSGTCYLCEELSDAACASKYGAGYQSSACNTYYKSTNAKSDGCHQCAPMTCDEIGDGTYPLSSCTSETCPNGKERACRSETFGKTTCYYKTTCNDDNQLVCPPAGTRLRVEYHVALGLNNNYTLADIDEQSPVDFEIVSTKGADNYEIKYNGRKVYETGNGGIYAHGLRFTGERDGELCAVEADKCLTDSYNYAMSDALKQEKENIGYLCDSCTDGEYTSYNCHCSGGKEENGQCLYNITVTYNCLGSNASYKTPGVGEGCASCPIYTTLPPLKDSNGVKYYINDQKIWYIPVNINRSNAQNNVIELNYELEETEPFTVFASGSDSGFGLGNQTLSECPAFRKEVYQFNGMDENNGIVQNPGEYTASLMRSDLVTEAEKTTDGITTKKYSLKGKGKHTLNHLHIDTINGN